MAVTLGDLDVAALLRLTRLPADRAILDGIDTSAGPEFSVSEAATVFFAGRPYWIRRLEKEHGFAFHRRSEGGARVYTLTDVEAMAHAMAGVGVVTVRQLIAALVAVQALAIVHGYLEFDGSVTEKGRGPLYALPEG